MDKIETYSDFLLYRSDDGSVNVKVVIDGHSETIWMTQKAMAELFGVDRTVITKHLKNIFDSSELQQNSVCAKFAHTAEDGKTYSTAFYNLDAIIAVGYRVNSYKATQFRIWATKILNEYLIKGFALDDDRLKQGDKMIESTVHHKFKEEMIIPYVAISNGLNFMLTKGERCVITADGIRAKVIDVQEKHICELEEDIQRLYGIDVWRFVCSWYKGHTNMDSMHFLVIKLEKDGN